MNILTQPLPAIHERSVRARALAGRIVASVLFVAGLVTNVAHMTLVGRYAHMTTGASITLDVLFAVLFVLSGAVVATGWARVATVPLAGAFMGIVHGLGWSVVEPLAGLGFVLLGPVALVATWHGLGMSHRAQALAAA